MPRLQIKSKKLEEANRLKKIRSILGLSQRAMAKEFKVAPASIALWESTKRTIPGPILVLLELYERELGLKPRVDKSEETFTKLKTSSLSRALQASTTAASVVAKMAGAALKEIFIKDPQRGQLQANVQRAIAQ